MVEAYAREIGLTLSTLAEASEHHYDTVLVHSYAHWSALSEILAPLRVDRVDYFSDGLRNELRFRAPHPALGTAPHLLYFGYSLLNDIVGRQFGPLPAQTVPLGDLAEFWHWLEVAHPSHGRAPADALQATDLLVAMRYWGRSRMYPTASAMASADALGALSIPAGVGRVVVRPDSRALVSADRMLERIRDVIPSGVEVAAWSDLIDDNPSLGSLDVLDRHAFVQSWDLGAFFAYDGSPNVLVGATQPRTTILWPSRRLIRRHVIDKSAAAAAAETVRIQRTVVTQFRAGVRLPNARTDGRREAAVLDALDPGLTVGRASWTPAESEAVILAALDVTGLTDSGSAPETVDRLRGLLADRVRFEHLATRATGPEILPQPPTTHEDT